MLNVGSMERRYTFERSVVLRVEVEIITIALAACWDVRGTCRHQWLVSDHDSFNEYAHS
jgi:hypothetical protein